VPGEKQQHAGRHQLVFAEPVSPPSAGELAEAPGTRALLPRHQGRENGLSEDELVATCVLLLFAGHETTTNLIGKRDRGPAPASFPTGGSRRRPAPGGLGRRGAHALRRATQAVTRIAVEMWSCAGGTSDVAPGSSST